MVSPCWRITMLVSPDALSPQNCCVCTANLGCHLENSLSNSTECRVKRLSLVCSHHAGESPFCRLRVGGLGLPRESLGGLLIDRRWPVNGGPVIGKLSLTSRLHSAGCKVLFHVSLRCSFTLPFCMSRLHAGGDVGTVFPFASDAEVGFVGQKGGERGRERAREKQQVTSPYPHRSPPMRVCGGCRVQGVVCSWLGRGCRVRGWVGCRV